MSTYFPPEQHKANPFEADEQDVLRRLDFNAGKLDKQIVRQYAGFHHYSQKKLLLRQVWPIVQLCQMPFLTMIKRIKSHDYYSFHDGE